MQDGAPPPCDYVINCFLKETFRGRVISRGTEFAGRAQPKSQFPPFHFLAVSQKQVHLQKQEPIDELMNVLSSLFVLRPGNDHAVGYECI